MDPSVPAWATLFAFFAAHDDELRNWALVVVPAIGVIAGWYAGHRKIQVEEEQREQQEQRLIHTENAEQTNAMTSQFRAIMEGYQARVVDLSREVSTLRQEVVSLRKAIDHQRVMCASCPKLPMLLKDAFNGTADATTAD